MTHDLPARLAAFERAALQWVHARLAEFTIDRRADDVSVLRSVKPIGDLAQLAEILARSTEHAAVATHLLDRCWDQLGDGDVLADFVERGGATLVLASVYPPFHRSTRRNSRLDARIAAIRKSELDQPSHRLPLVVTMAEIGATPAWSLSELLEKGWEELTRPGHVLSLRDAYALAHIAFYANAFGSRLDGGDHSRRAFLESGLDSVFDQFLAEGNLDIVAELALMLRLHPPLDAPARVWERLLLAQQDDGMVHRSSNESETARTRQQTAQEEFRDNYHATLVSIAACVAGAA